MHIWGLERDAESGASVFSSDGCPVVKRWTHMRGMWTEDARWRSNIFNPNDDLAVRRLARLIATLSTMYRWHRYGGAPGGVGGSSAHFEFSDAGFRWAWEVEGAASESSSESSAAANTRGQRRRGPALPSPP